MNRNDFLRQFMEMRQSIAPNPSAAAAVAAKEPSARRTKKGSAVREVLDGSIQHIIETKPPRKHVMEYLQEKCDGLTAAKMG